MKITAITVFLAVGLICSGCSETSENTRAVQEPQTLAEDTEDLESESLKVSGKPLSFNVPLV